MKGNDQEPMQSNSSTSCPKTPNGKGTQTIKTNKVKKKKTRGQHFPNRS